MKTYLAGELAGLLKRRDMHRIDDIDEAVFVSDDHAALRHKDELFVRDGKLLAIRSADHERSKAVLNPPPDFLKLHAEILFPACPWSRTSPSRENVLHHMPMHIR